MENKYKKNAGNPLYRQPVKQLGPVVRQGARQLGSVTRQIVEDAGKEFIHNQIQDVFNNTVIKGTPEKSMLGKAFAKGIGIMNNPQSPHANPRQSNSRSFDPIQDPFDNTLKPINNQLYPNLSDKMLSPHTMATQLMHRNKSGGNKVKKTVKKAVKKTVKKTVKKSVKKSVKKTVKKTVKKAVKK